MEETVRHGTVYPYLCVVSIRVYTLSSLKSAMYQVLAPDTCTSLPVYWKNPGCVVCTHFVFGLLMMDMDR